MKIELEDLYQTAPNEVQAQYRDGNIKELIQGISDIKKKFIQNAILSLSNDNLSITSAKGDGLDMWGNLLKFYRHIPDDTGSSGDVNYFNFGDKNFVNLQFLNPNAPNYSTLPDNLYRRFLVLIYQQMFIINTIPNVNEFINSFFSEYDNIVVRDTRDMSFIVYIFGGTNPMPTWLKWVLTNYDILPRPAGVGATFQEYTKGLRFGFIPEGNTDEWYWDNVGGFNGANFAETEE